ncbi:sensor histidine kinase [Herbaspirillum sp. alder98]|uniref:sensor histidine kinase n=1 Tax=Herbaspirillum sp. alder98 TaxID=2913096 RepID=UPI001CD8B6A3|nr:ATP-binding protein [Herbaspirillum sp. alder98]MCA1326784.1 histidine kinase [Herbaspirillum sp. alder98]
MYISARSPLVPVCAIALAALIFAIDALTPLDVAIAVLYVAVVLLSVAAWPRRGVIAMTTLCIVLTLVAYGMSHGLDQNDGALARCLVSLAAIAITAFLALKGQAAAFALIQREEALHTAQSQLAHASRVSTLGEMAASIAHEVNQPLAAIETHGEACLRWMNRPEPDLGEARSAVQAMQRDARRASDVIRRIRGMARKSDTEFVALDLNEMISDSCDLLRRELQRHGAQLQLELQPGLPILRADKVQLQQVLINLVMNAAQAMADAGVRERNILVRSLAARGEDGQGDGVAIEVVDSGPGFAPDHLKRLFDAFFTTKPDGMGMGLPICRSIIEAHGGVIRAWNGKPQGAVMRIHIPTAGAPEAA